MFSHKKSSKSRVGYHLNNLILQLKVKQLSQTCKNSHSLNNLLEGNHKIQFDLAESTAFSELVLDNRLNWSSLVHNLFKNKFWYFSFKMLSPLSNMYNFINSFTYGKH